MTRRPEVPLSSRCTMPGRRGLPTSAMVGAWARTAAARVPRAWPAPGCTTSPAGLSITMTSSSSNTIERVIGSGTRVSEGAGGASTSIRSPPDRRYAALRAAPSTRTWPASMSVCTRAREMAGAFSASQRSRRTPAAAAPTERIRGAAEAPRPSPFRPARRQRRAREEEAEAEQHHAHGDGGVGDVERRPVIPAQVHVHEVDHGAEARAIHEVPESPAEDEPDPQHALPAAGGQHAQGHPRQHEEGHQRQDSDHPAPGRRHAPEQPEGQSRVHHQGEVEKPLDHVDGNAEHEPIEHDDLGHLIDGGHGQGDGKDALHSMAATTGAHRSHRAGWRGSSPTRSLHTQHRWHFLPRALSTPMTRPGISWLSDRTALSEAAPKATCDTMKSVGS